MIVELDFGDLFIHPNHQLVGMLGTNHQREFHPRRSPPLGTVNLVRAACPLLGLDVNHSLPIRKAYASHSPESNFIRSSGLRLAGKWRFLTDQSPYRFSALMRLMARRLSEDRLASA